jgi:microcystin-dependent protein
MGTYQSKYTGQEIDNGINPVGNIISFMGTIAPSGYLVCDGAEVNIADYPNLATHFETQFGSKNYFGGDGATTFAVPDLRNEFLRGHGELSGEIGKHQDATQLPHLQTYQTESIIANFRADGASNIVVNKDTGIFEPSVRKYGTMNISVTSASNPTYEHFYAYTTRPTNVAVLYCIKY